MSKTSTTTTASDKDVAGKIPWRTSSGSDGLLSGSRRAVTGPQRPRNRSWGLVTLAALLVVGFGLAVAAWGLSAGEKASVLAVGEPVTKGHVLERKDLVSMAVAGVSDAIPVADINTVVGKTATVDLVAGQILSSSMVESSPAPGSGKSSVGLALDPARVPGDGLQAGDQVDVIAVPAGNVEGGDDKASSEALDSPVVLAKAAEVYAVSGSSKAGGQVLVTVIVDAVKAPKIAAYSGQNRVAVIETAADGQGAN